MGILVSPLRAQWAYDGRNQTELTGGPLPGRDRVCDSSDETRRDVTPK